MADERDDFFLLLFFTFVSSGLPFFYEDRRILGIEFVVVTVIVMLFYSEYT